MPDYVFYSRNRNHFITAQDDNEALEKAKCIAERHNIQTYLVMNEKSDAIYADYGDESLPQKENNAAEKEVIDSATYAKVKEMDREALSRFIRRYGDDLLERERRVIDYNGMKAELLKLSGIGKKRVEEIMAVVEKFV